ncbi:uncharacterized protein A1O9_12468 [Exophiala aquamarina CBS 119918]|uniref:Clr5 domain-containing protein n=1 Tax=Exophiala aquamarina CBS 119918 TaxID=1182545 RepID=A0A072NV95_9EURO|nr:uncharacterized protein A1O9_12468 [Exophiala aquamarina CBS 119918]KEF51551.1 hypothetical protein A1O9_12468 [Exophiala aquamarina CBS 119918]
MVRFENDSNDAPWSKETLPSSISDPNIDDVVRQADSAPAEGSMRPAARLRARRRAKVIPEHVWNKHKSTIEHLYIEKELTLTEVRAEMIASHGFDASPSMYKKRLGDWKKRKYYNSSSEERHLTTFQ